jgi:ankyrin repeat protein
MSLAPPVAKFRGASPGAIYRDEGSREGPIDPAASPRSAVAKKGPSRRRSASACSWVQLAAASLALVSAACPSRAADPCADKARAVEALHEGDQYQAAALLFAAARLGCEHEARALLDRGAAVDARDREGATALARAAQAGKMALIRLLLDRGARVNARTVDGSTALLYAAEADRVAAVALLLDRGADATIPGRAGLRPLAAAAYNGSEESAELLLKHGADPNALDDDGEGAMIYAAGRAHAPIVALLIAAGVDVNRRYSHDLTALMWAAGHDASAGVDDVDATLKVLIDHAAALDLKDDRGQTAADIARELGHERAARMLQR